MYKWQLTSYSSHEVLWNKKLDVVVELLALLFPVQEVLVSNLLPETGYANWSSWCPSSALPVNRGDSTSYLVTVISFQILTVHYSVLLFNPFGAGIIFLILAHSVYKMWIIQEPNKFELWNKLHFKERERKKRRVYTMFKIFGTYICWINI